MVCNLFFYDDEYGVYKLVLIYVRCWFKVYFIIFYGEKFLVMYDWVKIVLLLLIKKFEFGWNLNLCELNF